MHDMAIVEDPRFEGTTCDLSDSLGLQSQIVKNNTGDFTFFTRTGRLASDQSSNYEFNKKNVEARSVSPMIESVFTTRDEVNSLTYDDITEYNFLQNFLSLIDSEEFFVDDFMTQENLINHITYMIKQYLRKRNFDPSKLLDGLKTQLLEEIKQEEHAMSEQMRNSVLTFHHGFEADQENNQKGSFIEVSGTHYKKVNAGFVFEEPKWFLVKLIFLIAFLNKDKRVERENKDMHAYYAYEIFTEGLNFSNQKSIKPSFIISSFAILSEVLSKLQFYDDSSIYNSKVEKGSTSFYKANPKAMDQMINSHQCVSISALDFNRK